MMIVWLNGTFGVGKTTAAAAVDRWTDWRLFDPEHVGYLLQSNLRDIHHDDFQDLDPWRTLVPVVAGEILRFTPNPAMVAVQTVLREEYWRELRAGFDRQGLSVVHVLLDCARPELIRRIEQDEVEAQARDWRLDHVDRFAEARSWLIRAADLVVDTTERSVDEVATQIIDTLAPTVDETR